jgi:predicted short-subunit dehydrogenase-like oxidoreductase (DUF2520 family)
MLNISSRILKDQDLKLEMLKPLIRETLNNSLEISPKKAQTGPARRGDRQTINRHLQFLSGHPDRAELYDFLSRHILTSFDHGAS